MATANKKVDKILRLKSETERLKSERDKSKGAFERVLSQIKKQFDCSDIPSAKKLLQRMQKKYKKLLAQRDQGIEDCQQELEDHRNTDEH